MPRTPKANGPISGSAYPLAGASAARSFETGVKRLLARHFGRWRHRCPGPRLRDRCPSRHGRLGRARGRRVRARATRPDRETGRAAGGEPAGTSRRWRARASRDPRSPANAPGSGRCTGARVPAADLPALPARCKYEPSCSSYAIEALRSYGVVRGSILAAWRLLRCNPGATADTTRLMRRCYFGAARSG